MDLIIGIVFVVSLIYWILLLSKLENKRYKEHLYVLKKNGHYYYAHRSIRVKNPDTGAWFDAVAYTDNNDNQRVYAREEEDFFDKFVPFKEWKNEVQSN